MVYYWRSVSWKITIKINGKIFNGSIVTQENIDINKSKIAGSVTNKTNGITINKSKIAGSVNTLTGKVSINNSTVDGDVQTSTNAISIENKSHIKGSVTTNTGKITINNSTVDGNVETDTDDLYAENSVINGILTAQADKINLTNCKVKGMNISGYVFTLTKGNTITGDVEFNKDDYGKLIVEKGAIFDGNVINGEVERQ